LSGLSWEEADTRKSYPNAAYGHMDNEIRLGYQAGVVSLVSESYGRLWLSGTHHSVDTVSSTQAETLISEAETRLGLRPWHRTELLEKRIADYGPIQESIQQRLQTQQNDRQTALEPPGFAAQTCPGGQETLRKPEKGHPGGRSQIRKNPGPCPGIAGRNRWIALSYMSRRFLSNLF